MFYGAHNTKNAFKVYLCVFVCMEDVVYKHTKMQ